MEKISDNYLILQKKLHEDPNYGVASLSFSPMVAQVIRNFNIKTVSDYGAGKKNLFIGLCNAGIQLEDYYAYDPVFPEYGPPREADLVCCIDVLEHIEPHCIEAVLVDLHSITKGLAFLSVHMGPAGKILSDGRNAHLTQQPSSWWLPKICQYFNVLQLVSHQLMGSGFWILAQRIDRK
jgi:hypothetical protein